MSKYESGNSASSLLGNLKSIQKESSKEKISAVSDTLETEKFPSIPDPRETAMRLRALSQQKETAEENNSEFLYSPIKPEEKDYDILHPKNRLVHKGNDFVIERKEIKNTQKHFLVPSRLAEAFADEAREYGISQNDLFTQILKNRYDKKDTI